MHEGLSDHFEIIKKSLAHYFETLVKLSGKDGFA